MSGGGVAIVGSDLQLEMGIVDSPEIATQDFFEWGEDPDPYWVDYYAQHSRIELGQWLESLGVRWTGVNPQFGNSVPRFHRTNGRGLGLVTPIYRQVLRYPNVNFRWIAGGGRSRCRRSGRGLENWRKRRTARRSCFVGDWWISEQHGDGAAFLARRPR